MENESQQKTSLGNKIFSTFKRQKMFSGLKFFQCHHITTTIITSTTTPSSPLSLPPSPSPLPPLPPHHHATISTSTSPFVPPPNIEKCFPLKMLSAQTNEHK
ncbi:hypothetical protein CsSME_00053486 [Camellia sinensis var. sinensis]